MAFIGNVPAESYITTVKDTFSGNGSTTAFTLSQPTLTNDVRVVVENVVQEPTTAYSVAGTTLTFTSAPPSGSNNVYVIHLGPAVQTVTPPETFGVGSIFGASDTDTAITFEGSGVTTFDQNGAEAARFDASGNLLVGKTAIGQGTAGFEARATGQTFCTDDGNTPFLVNRLTSDGELIQLNKDGTNVGSIGTTASDLCFTSNNVGFRMDGSNNHIIPVNNSLATRDAAIDLGYSSGRFKDLYLSGGVYLGGTTSANFLDDYEEGTWVPTGNNITFGGYSAHYVKLGKLVYVGVQVSFPSTSDTNAAQIRDLPFTVGSNDQSRAGLSVSYSNVGFAVLPLGNDGGTQILLRNWSGNNITNSQLSGASIFVGGWYSTA